MIRSLHPTAPSVKDKHFKPPASAQGWSLLNITSRTTFGPAAFSYAPVRE
jgi:hypothetical protein